MFVCVYVQIEYILNQGRRQSYTCHFMTYAAIPLGRLQATKSSRTSNSGISLARFMPESPRPRSLLPSVGVKLVRLLVLRVLMRSSSREDDSRLSSRAMRTRLLRGLRLPRWMPVMVETLLSLELLCERW